MLPQLTHCALNNAERYLQTSVIRQGELHTATMQIGQDLKAILFCGHRQADMALTGQTISADLER